VTSTHARIEELLDRGRSQGHLTLGEVRNAFQESGITPGQGRTIIRELTDTGVRLASEDNRNVEAHVGHKGTRVRAYSRRNSRTQRVTWAAGSMATIATWLLPGPERARYAEEFMGELWDIHGRWRQMVHAARLMARFPSHYFALRSPHRSKAS
jgi:hypothetical protein